MLPANDELAPYEKLIEGISQLASLMRAYYEALRESGFSAQEAIFLTSEYQKVILGSAKKGND